jgi:16S rRNA (cytosine967-C5)-methyltransferase
MRAAGAGSTDEVGPSAAEERLRTLPWRALSGLAPALDVPIGEVLAGASTERVVDRTLRALSPLDRDQRAAVAEALFGIGLWRLRLHHHLGPDPDPRKLLASLLRDLGAVADAEAVVGIPAGTLPPPRPAPRDLATRYSLPAWLAEIVSAEAGHDVAALADALDRPAPICLRPNALRIDSASLRDRLLEEGVEARPGQLVPTALVVTSPRPNLHGLRTWNEALFEVQDEASQLAGSMLGALPGESALDLCAGAGGKTLQLAAAVGPRGVVHACDPDAERLTRLRTRTRRAGAEAIVRVGGDSPPRDLVADRVLVDAPCSELGALRRGPDQRFRLDPAGFPALERLQLELLCRGADHLRPGGTLGYATCTIRSAENEAIARLFERARPGFVRRAERRTWPHREGSDGFYVAIWSAPFDR